MEQQMMIGPPLPPPPLPPPPPEEQPPPPPPPIDRNEEPQQHGQCYAQQDQDVSAAQSQNAQLRSQEEEWALKARAWASAKSAQGDAVKSTPQNGQPNNQDGQLYKQAPVEQQYQHPHAISDGYTAAATWSAPFPSAQFEQTLRQPVPFGPSHMFPGTPPGTFQAPGYRPAGMFGFVVDPVQKKSAVPSWMREELKKKGAASAAPDGLIRRNGTESLVTASSDTEAEEDEEELETVKAAAINQEIKKVLTDVLLKVTDGLFNEIAEEILNEGKKDALAKDGNSRASEARIVFAAIDGDDPARATNLLGLASYDSDNDVKEGDNSSSSPSKPAADRIFGPLEADESAAKEAADTRAAGIQEKDAVPPRTDKQHNKENEHRPLKEHIRGEHRHRERKRSRRSPSPGRSSRSSSPGSPRKRKERHHRSRSPRAHKRESSSWSRSRSPRKRSPSREKHRHKHSRSRSPRRKRR